MRCWASRRELHKMDKQHKTNKIFFMAFFFILIGCKIIEYVDEMFKDMDKLIKTIREYNKKPIILVGYYNPIPFSETNKTTMDTIFNYIDLKFNELLGKNIYYVDIYEIFKNKEYYLPNKNNVFPSLEGYNLISNEIIKLIEEEKLI